MKLHVDTEGLAGQIAETIIRHVERLLPDAINAVTTRLHGKQSLTSDSSQKVGAEIMGLHPFALYPVAFVAERWDVSRDYVRKKPESELPRSNWKGGEIRYRGIDILRYEGVNVDHLCDATSEYAPDGSACEMERNSLSPNRAQPKITHSPATSHNAGGRPYRSDLPNLSD